MKTRSSFVTNSSSTTYVCEISGESETFHDSINYRDFGFIMCENEHVMLEGFELGEITPEIARSWISRYPYAEANVDVDEMTDYEVLDYCSESLEDFGDIPQELCPICQFKALSQPRLSRYLLKKYGVSRDDVFAEIKKLNKRRKKLYDNEYNRYVMQKYELTEDGILEELRNEFGSIKEFMQYIGSWWRQD